MIEQVLNWAETWALLLPLSLMFKKMDAGLTPLKWYIAAALIINLVIDIISNQIQLNITLPWHNNGLLYNLHSIVRLLFFTWFFNKFQASRSRLRLLVVTVLFMLFIFIYFIGFRSIINFNSLTIGLEMTILLVYSLSFYLTLFQEESLKDFLKYPAFWTVTGLGIFISVNLIIYLLYNDLSVYETEFAIKIWNVHNVAFIVMCVFFTIAFKKGAIEAGSNQTPLAA